MNKFNSASYWKQRGKNEYYMNNHRLLHQRIIYNKYFLDKIDKKLYEVFDKLSFETVLEIGCGWGFMTKKLLDRYTDINFYFGFDVSKDQINASHNHIKDKRFITLESSIESYPWRNNFFDLVFESTVFIHLPPNEIKFAIQKAFDSCKKYVVSWDWYDKQKIGETVGNPPYCFNHDYETLYLNAGAKKVDVIPVKHTLSFLKFFTKLFSYQPCLVVAYK